MRYSDVLNCLQKLIYKKPSQKEIGLILGLGQTAIAGRAARNSDFSEEEISKINEYYSVNICAAASSEIDDCLNLPILGDVTASMGNGIEVYNETRTGFLRISAKVLKDIGANPNTSDVIIAEGDSMEPTIQGGSTLIIDRSRTEVKDGKIYCINFNGALMAKRLQLLPPKKLRVISDNFNKYPAWDVDFQQEIDFSFNVVGEVMRWMTNAR